MHWFIKMFHVCKYEFVNGSMKPNGNKTMDWAANIVPEYDAIERCSCGNERVIRFISYADTPNLRRK